MLGHLAPFGTQVNLNPVTNLTSLRVLCFNFEGPTEMRAWPANMFANMRAIVHLPELSFYVKGGRPTHARGLFADAQVRIGLVRVLQGAWLGGSTALGYVLCVGFSWPAERQAWLLMMSSMTSLASLGPVL